MHTFDIYIQDLLEEEKGRNSAGIFNNEMIILRIQASLSLDARLTVNEPTPYDRIFVPNNPDIPNPDIPNLDVPNPDVPNTNNSPKSEFLVMPSKIFDDNIISDISLMNLDTNLSLHMPCPLSIVSGPYIENITYNEVIISIIVKGQGYIYCNLFELPVYADYHDALSILSTETERKRMKIEQKLEKYCDFMNENKIFFKFVDLESYSNYCGVFSFSPFPNVSNEIMTILQFNTLSHSYNDQQSMVVVPILNQKNVRNNRYTQNNISDISNYNTLSYGNNAGSYNPLPCIGNECKNYRNEKNKRILGNKEIQADIRYKLLQISSLIDSHTRRKALPISISPLPIDVTNKFQIKNNSNIHATLLRLNMYNMNKNNNFIIFNSMIFKNINIELEGQFCRLTSNDTINTTTYICNLIIIINQLKKSNYNHIKILTIVLDYSVIKHLQINNGEKNIKNHYKLQQSWNDNKKKFENDISKNLLNLLLFWKSYCKYRDCIIVSTLPVECTKCVTITLKIRKKNDEYKTNANQSLVPEPLTSNYEKNQNNYNEIKIHTRNDNSTNTLNNLSNNGKKNRKYHRISIRQVILPFKINKSMNSKNDLKCMPNVPKNLEFIFPIGLQKMGKSFTGRGSIEYIVENISNQLFSNHSIVSPHSSLILENKAYL